MKTMPFFKILILLLLSQSLLAQGVIRGRVIDKNSNEALPGANVVLMGTVLGASTNLEGKFEIRRVPYGTYSVRVSMIGYAKQTIENVKVLLDSNPEITVELEEAAVEIDPVVVTVSKWAQEAQKTPASVEVLTARDIMSRNPIQIEDALETAAGVQILKENVNIRGSDGWTFGVGSRVLVLIDGIPAMTSDMGRANFFMASPPDIERVEIVRGAGSALYGSSAMGGVVNFITRGPSAKPRTYIRATVGAQGDWNRTTESTDWDDWSDSLPTFNRQDFFHSRRIGNLGVRLSGARSFSSGYIERTAYERYNIAAKLDYTFPNASTLTLSGSYMHDDSEVFVLWRPETSPNPVPFAAEGERDKEQIRQGVSLSGKYSLPISSKASLELRGFYNRFDLGLQLGAVDFAPALGMGSTVQGHYLPAKSLSIIYGSDFRYEEMSSVTYGKREAFLYAPYLQADWQPVEKLNFVLGGRYDHYQISTDFSAEKFPLGQTFEHFSPKFGVNYRPFDNTTLRVAVANGFKFPIVFQLYLEGVEILTFPFQGDPNLRSEESWSYEIGWRQNITPTWFFEVNGFLTNVDDLIEPGIVNNSALSFVNIPEVKIPGVEFVTNGSWWNDRIGLRASLTYIDPEDQDTGELLRYRQKFIAFLGTSLRPGDFELQVDYKYASEQKDYIFPGLHQFVPQKVLDTRLLYYWRSFTFQVGVDNALNYAYTLRDRMLEPNRSFSAGFSAEF